MIISEPIKNCDCRFKIDLMDVPAQVQLRFESLCDNTDN